MLGADAEPRRRVAVLDGALRRARRGHHAPARRQLPRAPRRAGRGPRRGVAADRRGCSATRTPTPSTTRTYTAADVSDWVLWHDGNPNAVASCITLARENARSVREQISGEMWEAINKLFLLVAPREPPRRRRAAPHAFFEELRNGAHLLPGRGRRDDDARRAVRVHPARPPPRAGRDDGRGSSAPAIRSPSRSTTTTPPRVHELIALLKSCSAFEAYVRRHGTRSSRSRSRRSSIRSRGLPARGRSIASRTASTPSSGSRATRRAPHRMLGRLARGSRVRGARATRPARRVHAHAAASCSSASTRRRGAHEGVSSRAARCPSPRSRPRRRSSSNVADASSTSRASRTTRPINEAYTELRLKPAHRDGQRCSSFALETEPRGATVDEYRRPLRQHACTTSTCSSRTSGSSSRPGARSGRREALRRDEAPPSPLDRWDLLRRPATCREDAESTSWARSRRRPPTRTVAARELMRAVRAAHDVRARVDHVLHARRRGARPTAAASARTSRT